MPKRRQTDQSFVKGVNRRFPRSKSDTGAPYTLKNARIGNQGETGYVTRMEGAEEVLSIAPVENVVDAVVVAGTVDSLDRRDPKKPLDPRVSAVSKVSDKGFRKHVILRFTEGMGLTGTDEAVTFVGRNLSIINRMDLNELFNESGRISLYFTEGLELGERFSFRGSVTQLFVDEIPAEEIFITSNHTTLQFEEEVRILDYPVECTVITSVG